MSVWLVASSRATACEGAALQVLQLAGDPLNACCIAIPSKMLTASDGGCSTGGTAPSSKGRRFDFAVLVMAPSAIANDLGTGQRIGQHFLRLHVHRSNFGDERHVKHVNSTSSFTALIWIILCPACTFSLPTGSGRSSAALLVLDQGIWLPLCFWRAKS